MSQRKLTILVEGNIGSGKSTFLKYLEKAIDLQIFPEPIPHWTNFNGCNLLQKLYQNPREWIFPFQLYAALTLCNNHLKESNKKYKVMERSIFSSKYCFLEAAKINGTIQPIHHNILQKWLEFTESNIKIDVDMIIYLKCNPEISLERIRKRNRPEEVNIQLSYVQLLNELHNNWLIKGKDDNQISVIIINANLNEDAIQSEYDRAIEEILKLN